MIVTISSYWKNVAQNKYLASKICYQYNMALKRIKSAERHIPAISLSEIDASLSRLRWANKIKSIVVSYIVESLLMDVHGYAGKKELFIV